MTGAGTDVRTAVEWLVSVASDPEGCRFAWERDPSGVALLPAGRGWDVLIVPGPLGRSTLDVLERLTPRPGPVLARSEGALHGFFVPAGTNGCWVAKGVRGAGVGSWIAVPYPGCGARHATRHLQWAVAPDGSGVLTDPELLELAMHDAVARTARDPSRDG
ncbi:hypothetical protein [Streptomyces tsukubensis]|uniref:DNA primase/polymerase bifunctional N-terminal domain-containing protein n=1 Tax=Streptomyces tsukubensis TaxID=83656 RepID=A0A1V4A5F2_9ACTN|nr:hypothetical protein [Streptomyces tsukubensis]OON76433.1 hypothetical protein B1H18_21085 [Streptomyces tsukubensis]QFR98041.1 hypothetical protein GBW32_26885 [Streptomyces tsukubensis]